MKMNPLENSMQAQNSTRRIPRTLVATPSIEFSNEKPWFSSNKWYLVLAKRPQIKQYANENKVEIEWVLFQKSGFFFQIHFI